MSSEIGDIVGDGGSQNIAERYFLSLTLASSPPTPHNPFIIVMSLERTCQLVPKIHMKNKKNIIRQVVYTIDILLSHFLFFRRVEYQR
jgi:hypothetical protein